MMIDIGRTIGAGVRLVRERPTAVAVWTLINIVMTSAAQLSIMPFMRLVMQNRTGATSPLEMGTAMVPLYGIQFLMMIAQLVLWAAVYRAVLRPQESAAAYLRLGGDELRLFLLGLIYMIIAMVLVFLPLALMGAAAGFTATAGGEPDLVRMGGMIALMLLVGLLLFMLVIFLSVRFALAWPLTFLRRQIVLGEAWRLSRGNFWPMFASAMVVIVFLYVCSIVVSAIQTGGMMFNMQGLGGDPQAAEELMMQRFTQVTPLGVVAWVVGGIVGMGWIIGMAAGIADVAQQLLPDDHEALEEIWS